MRSRRLITLAAISALTFVPMSSALADTTAATAPTATNAPAAYNAATDPIATCMASQPYPVLKHRGKGPVKVLMKGLASEAGTDLKDTLADSIFVFSAKDVDPYKHKAPKNKPYTALEITFVDGTMSKLIKFPDGSAKIEGSHFNGSIIALAGPGSPGVYIIAYPNGTRGKIVSTDDGYKIYRPDNTITSVKQGVGGQYTIENNKLGYLGTANSDKEGMQWEFGSKSF